MLVQRFRDAGRARNPSHAMVAPQALIQQKKPASKALEANPISRIPESAEHLSIQMLLLHSLRQGFCQYL